MIGIKKGQNDCNFFGLRANNVLKDDESVNDNYLLLLKI